jgi:hypothetical protein
MRVYGPGRYHLAEGVRTAGTPLTSWPLSGPRGQEARLSQRLALIRIAIGSGRLLAKCGEGMGGVGRKMSAFTLCADLFVWPLPNGERRLRHAPRWVAPKRLDGTVL